MADSPSLEERLKLITNRISPDDIHGLHIITQLLSDRRTRRPRCLWAVSPTGRPHIGYIASLLKLAEFIRAGFDVVINILDVYAYLGNAREPLSQVTERFNFYKFTIQAVLEALGVPLSRVHFVQESSYVTTPSFIQDQWRMHIITPIEDIVAAGGSEFNPLVLGPMYGPSLRSLAEEHLDADVELGGANQDKIFKFSEKFLPRLGYRDRARLTTPILPNRHGKRMSSSDESRLKIMFLDNEATIKHKVKRATQITRDPVNNSVLAILRDILIPMEELRKEGVLSGATGGSDEEFVLSDQDKQSKRLFKSYRMTEQWFRAGMLSRNDLARVVTKGIDDLLSPIRESYQQNAQWQSSNLFGYPGNEG